MSPMTGPDDWRHGTAGGYTNQSCRCERCRAAFAAYTTKRRRERTVLLRDDPTLAQHGKATTYHNWGCRCEPCTKANTKDKSERLARYRARGLQ